MKRALLLLSLFVNACIQFDSARDEGCSRRPELCDRASPDGSVEPGDGGGTVNDGGTTDAGPTDGGGDDAGEQDAGLPGWLTVNGCTGSYFQHAYDVAASAAGDVFVSGDFRGTCSLPTQQNSPSATLTTAYFSRYTSEGAPGFTYFPTGSSGPIEGVGIADDGDGGFFFAALAHNSGNVVTFSPDAGFTVGGGCSAERTAIGRFAMDGGLRWMVTQTCDNQQCAAGSCTTSRLVSRPEADLLVVAGGAANNYYDPPPSCAAGTTSAQGWTLLWLNAAGACQHFKTVTCSAPGANNTSVAQDVAIDESKDIAVLGKIDQTCSFGNNPSGSPITLSGSNLKMIADYRADSIVKWVRYVGTGGDEAARVAFHGGRIVIAFSFANPYPAGSPVHTPNGGSDIGLLEVSTYDGSAVSPAWVVGGDGTDQVTGLAFDRNGKLVLSGTYSGSGPDFGRGPLPSDGGLQLFVEHLDFAPDGGFVDLGTDLLGGGGTRSLLTAVDGNNQTVAAGTLNPGASVDLGGGLQTNSAAGAASFVGKVR